MNNTIGNVMAEKKKEVIVEAETIFKEVKKDKKLSHYIDNSKLLAEMIKYKDQVLLFRKGEIQEKPKISEYIGSCILLIAERLSTRPNFAAYTYREEMVSDGIENCLMYIDNFDPEKSKNPFAYLTQIIYFAFIRRIHKEKKQSYVKMRLFESMDKYGVINSVVQQTEEETRHTSNNLYADYYRLSDADLKYYDEKNAPKKVKAPRKNKKKDKNLESFFEDKKK